MEMVQSRTNKQFSSVATDEEDFRQDVNVVSVGVSRKWMATMIAAVMCLMALTSFLTLYATNVLTTTGAMSGRTRTRRWIPTLLTDIAVYPGYAGGLIPRGRVTVRFEDDENELLMRFELEGLEANCKECGIHIHEGESCEEAADYYFNHSLYESNTSPWKEAVYNSNEQGDASNALVVPTGGMGSAATKGHTVVVNSQDGTRIGCGVLTNFFNINSMQADIGVYPGYDNAGDKRISPTGTASIMAFEDNVLRLRGTLDGLEPNCINCGLHIHAGLLSCNATEEIGDHWYEEKEMAGDPWVAQKATYTSDTKGHAKFAFYVYNGFDYENNIDHVLVIHGQDSTRIGCGVIKPREVSS